MSATQTPINMQQMKGMIMILVTGILLSTVVLILENVCYKLSIGKTFFVWNV